MTKRKSFAEDSEVEAESRQWSCFEEAKEVEANLLRALKLLQGNSPSNGTPGLRDPLKATITKSLKLAQAYLADEGQKRGSRRLRSSAGEEDIKPALPALPDLAQPPLVVCLSKPELFKWHGRLFLPRQQTLLAGFHEPRWVLQEDLTGVAVSLTYCWGSLKEIHTMAGGARATDITSSIQPSLLHLPTSVGAPCPILMVTGKLIVAQQLYQMYCDACHRQNTAFSHGTLEHFVAALLEVPTAGHELVFCPERVVFVNSMGAVPTSISASQAWLEVQGFQTLLGKRTFPSFQDAVAEAASCMVTRSKATFEVRGVRIMVDDFATQEQLGLLPDGCTTGAVTWEYPPFQEITRLNAVKWLWTADGSLAPQAVLEPVAVGGLTVETLGFGGLAILRRLDVKVNDCVVVERSVGFGPLILKAVPDLRTGNEIPWEDAASCPECSNRLEDCTDLGVTKLHCGNLQCPSQSGRLVRHFASICLKDSGSAPWLDALQKKGLVNTISDLFQISQADLEKQAGLNKRTAKVVSDEVAAARDTPIGVLLLGLGIRHMDQSAAKLLGMLFGSLSALEKAHKLGALEGLKGVSQELAWSLGEWFSLPATAQLMESLGTSDHQDIGQKRKQARRPSAAQRTRRSRSTAADQENRCINTKEAVDRDASRLAGKAIAVAGKLAWSGKTRDEFRALVEAAGGKLTASISTKTDYLVIGSAPEQSRLDLATRHQVCIVEEVHFFKTWLNFMEID